LDIEKKGPNKKLFLGRPAVCITPSTDLSAYMRRPLRSEALNPAGLIFLSTEHQNEQRSKK